MTDPHADDYCVICGRGATLNGPEIHPVASIENGVICNTHVTMKENGSFGGYQ